jgi:di- and tripeptidase
MRRFNKFFDSQKQDSPDQSDVDDDSANERIPLLEIEPRNQVLFAHYGYVYCLHLGSLPHSSEEVLFSGGGDGDVKLWSLDCQHVKTLSSSDDGVLTMVHIESLLYTGHSSGTINLWDLDTMQMIRSVRAHQADVLSLSGIEGCAFSGSARGFLKKWDLKSYPYSHN